MAWIPITDPEVVGWEYSDDPNTDKRSNDTYDYDANTAHVAGIVTLSSGKTKVVLARQTSHPHPGYGELMVDFT